jgi:predicted nucleic acid-binding protein
VARYIESSALIAALIEGDATARQSIRGEGQRYTSALTLAEYARRVVRARQAGEIDASDVRLAMTWLRRFVRGCAVINVNDTVLARVRRPFPIEPIRTLDAIHLATIETHPEEPALVTIVTRDKRIAANARAMGYAVE